MKKIIFVVVASLIFVSCSESGKRMSENLEEEIFQEVDVTSLEVKSSMDSLFEKTVEDIDIFMSKHGDWKGNYYWTSEKIEDKPFSFIRLSRLLALSNSSDFLSIEKSKRDSNEIVRYAIERTREFDEGENFYFLKTSFFKNGKEVESQKESFILSSPEELEAALKPFYKRLEEAKKDVRERIKKDVSRIEKVASKG